MGRQGGGGGGGSSVPASGRRLTGTSKDVERDARPGSGYFEYAAFPAAYGTSSVRAYLTPIAGSEPRAGARNY